MCGPWARYVQLDTHGRRSKVGPLGDVDAPIVHLWHASSLQGLRSISCEVQAGRYLQGVAAEPELCGRRAER